MNRKMMRATFGVAMLAMLAACGNAGSEGSIRGMLVTAVKQSAAKASGKDAAAQPAPDPSAMAAEALRVNPGPLILVGLERMNTTQVMAMTGDNAGQRTYMTKNEQAFVMRGGMLAALHRGESLVKAIQTGTVAASFCVEKYGTQEHFFDRKIFDYRFSNTFDWE